jgi:hypothetical protein
LKVRQLAKLLIKQKPKRDGENFWVFSVIVDDPDLLTYDQRFTMMGTYEQNVSSCSPILELLFNQRLNVKMEQYQGEDARRFLEKIGSQEVKYQQEKDSIRRN